MSAMHQRMSQLETNYWSEIRLSSVPDLKDEGIIVGVSPQHLQEAEDKHIDLNQPGTVRIVPLPFHLVQNPNQFN